MGDRARDLAEAKLLLPLVKRFRALMDQYGVYSAFWEGGTGAGDNDDRHPCSTEMLLNAIGDPERLKAFVLGVKDDDVYRIYKSHDHQCRAMTGRGERCDKDARCDRSGRMRNQAGFDANASESQFCDYHYGRIPDGNVRLWSEPGVTVKDDEGDQDDQSEAA
jgi:hypothetical protein